MYFYVCSMVGYVDRENEVKKIAKFSKVDCGIFAAEACKVFGITEDEAAEGYNLIKQPRRATTGSAGYDFYAPFDMEIKPGETVKVPTGIRASIAEGWVLMIFPRSGLGFKYRLQLDNTVGVIDSDYFFSDNQGHIMIKITNCSATSAENTGKTVVIKAGEAFAQGVFLEYGIVENDDADGIRNGGLGSTTGR